jgi:hypothetical protein
VSRDWHGGRARAGSPGPPGLREAPHVSDHAARAGLGKGGLPAVADGCAESSYMTGVQIVVERNESVVRAARGVEGYARAADRAPAHRGGDRYVRGTCGRLRLLKNS